MSPNPVPGEEISDHALVRSLRSHVCPACKGAKRAWITLCPACYRSIPYGLRQALYNKLGHGYREAIQAAFACLKKTAFYVTE
jgi:hypothetical protein